MKLGLLITQYITYRKALGEKFRTNEECLNYFCKTIGSTRNISQITEEEVTLFLYGSKKVPITSGWFVRHNALLGFYHYAHTRGYVEQVPLPTVLPKHPQPFVPYIYSKDDLRCLLKAAGSYQKHKSSIQPQMIQTILILLYGTGLRIGEALSLKLDDISLEQNLITVRDSKFYKSRLVPIGNQLRGVLSDYLVERAQYALNNDPDTHLFIRNNNLPLSIHTMQNIFQKIRKKAGLVGYEGSSYLPRLQDLRHSFAIHHLINWYQEKKDIQKLLPILSTYMGHSQLAHTTVYLSMTADLLREAGARFEEYAMGGGQS